MRSYCGLLVRTRRVDCLRSVTKAGGAQREAGPTSQCIASTAPTHASGNPLALAKCEPQMRIYLIGFGVANFAQAADLSTHAVPHAVDAIRSVLVVMIVTMRMATVLVMSGEQVTEESVVFSRFSCTLAGT